MKAIKELLTFIGFLDPKFSQLTQGEPCEGYTIRGAYIIAKFRNCKMLVPLHGFVKILPYKIRKQLENEL